MNDQTLLRLWLETLPTVDGLEVPLNYTLKHLREFTKKVQQADRISWAASEGTIGDKWIIKLEYDPDDQVHEAYFCHCNPGLRGDHFHYEQASTLDELKTKCQQWIDNLLISLLCYPED